MHSDQKQALPPLAKKRLRRQEALNIMKSHHEPLTRELNVLAHGAFRPYLIAK